MFIRIKNMLKAHLPAECYERLRRLWSGLRKGAFRVANLFYRRCQIQSDKIVFDNYICKDYGCNPKYVAQELIRRGAAERYDLVWILAGDGVARSELPPCFRIVPYGSLASLREYATARLWVSNYHKRELLNCGLSKRAGQSYIQMWHGSLGIKRIDNDVPSFQQRRGWFPTLMRSSGMVDYWISNSDYETGVYKSAFWGVKDAQILLYGHPRNDIFFDPAAMRRSREKVAGRYKLEGKRLLLYAPTFRERVTRFDEIEHYAGDAGIEFDALLSRVRQRFGGGWALLVRQHPSVPEPLAGIGASSEDIVDVTDFADMQELLAAADCLLTDYSSCAFDFMLTRRPVFLYAPDLQAYNAQRGFYYPIETTPFPLAQSFDELMENIGAFDEEAYLPGVEAFLRDKGCVEDGHASERVADLIERIMEPMETGSAPTGR